MIGVREGCRKLAHSHFGHSHFGLCLAIFLAFGFSNIAAAACNFRTSSRVEELGNLSSVRSLEIEHENYRKWVKNGLAIVKSRSDTIGSMRKRKFKARIIVNYDFGRCVYTAVIRQHGDWRDHITFVRGKLAQSVDVKLRDGNIAGIVKFKLLLKETRNGENEIFGTLLFRKLGFLAPRTRMMQVKQNDLSLEMLFQEKATKEFLEAQSRREGPIFEGDEGLTWGGGGYRRFELGHLGLARMSNENWAKKGPTSLGISLNAFAKLQKAYVYRANGIIIGAKSGLVIDLPHNTEADARRFAEYEAILVAINGKHALVPFNRKYYWNAFLGSFEPIYYDGNIAFGPLDKGRRIIRSGDAAFFLEKFDAAVLAKVKTDVGRVLDNAFAVEFAQAAGFSLRESKKTVATIAGVFARNIDDLPRFLSGLATAGPSQFEALSAEAARAELIQRHLGIFPQTIFLDIAEIDKSDGTVSVICLLVSECDIETLSLSETADLMASIDIDSKGSIILLPSDRNSDQNDQTLAILEPPGIRVLHARGASVSFDPATRVISLMQDQADDWFLFLGQDLNGLRIIMDGIIKVAGAGEAGQRFNEFGLTGCVNIVDSTLRNVSISIANGACEDSLNVVSSIGQIEDILIRNGFSDAVDLDFSQLWIAQVKVEMTGNDCFDVSSGSYELIDAQFSGCGDKGLSVGERSVVEVQTISVESALIGVSSKDSSRVTINAAELTGVPTCLEAYRKKQEFDGAVLSVGTFSCPDGVSVSDDESTIELGGL